MHPYRWNGLMVRKLIFHSHQSSTQLNTYGKFWSDMIGSALTTIIKPPNEGISLRKMQFIPPIELRIRIDFIRILSENTRNLTPISSGSQCTHIQFNSIQFSFIYIAPNHNKSHLRALFTWSKSRPYSFIYRERDPTIPP